MQKAHSTLKTKLFSFIFAAVSLLIATQIQAGAQEIAIEKRVDASALLPHEAAILKQIYQHNNLNFDNQKIYQINESDLITTTEDYMYLSRKKSDSEPYLRSLFELTTVVINEKNQIISLNLSQPKDKPFLPISGFKHLKGLRLGGGVTHVPQLSDLPALEVLDISVSTITKFPDLNNLPNLRVLDMSGLEKLKIISSDTNQLLLPSLETLILSLSDIKQLDLSIFPNLRKLYVNYNKLTELDFTHTPYLEELNLERCGIKTFDKFKGITNLKHMRKLAISGRPFGYFPLNKVAHFKEMIELKADIRSDADLKAVAGFKNAKNLDLHINKKIITLESLSFLTDKHSLEELIISARIKSTKGLYNLKKLRKLWLLSKIDKFEDMHGLDSLREIQFTGSSIKDMSGLSAVTTVRKIFCNDSWGCHIGKLGGLENMKNLEILDLPKSGITKIQGLDKGLKKLRILNLNKNRISKLEGLDNLTNLEQLTIKKNKITKLEGLDNLNSLVWLDLGGNPIKKMEGLDKLTNLERLFLEQTDIELLENYQNLTSLYGHIWSHKILNNPANKKAINEINKMGLSKKAQAAGERSRERDKRDNKTSRARHAKKVTAEAKRLREKYIDWVKRGKKYQTKK